jgi:hypothetical protein
MPRVQKLRGFVAPKGSQAGGASEQFGGLFNAEDEAARSRRLVASER